MLSIDLTLNHFGTDCLSGGWHEIKLNVIAETPKAYKLNTNASGKHFIWLPKSALKEVFYDDKHFVGYELKKWFNADDWQNHFFTQYCTTVVVSEFAKEN